MSVLMKRQAFNISRPGVATRVDGKYVAGTPATFSITGSLQQLSGEDLEHIPSGDISRERGALTTKTQLLNRDEVTEVATDKEYQVERDADWSKQGVTKATQHYRYILVLKEDE